MFSDGRCLKQGEEAHMKKQEGRPGSETDEMKRYMHIHLDDNCRLTVTNFAHEVGCRTAKHALKELEMHKVCARRTPHELVPEIREQQVLTEQTLAARYNKKDGTEFAGAGSNW